jgi:hypothetical protein
LKNHQISWLGQFGATSKARTLIARQEARCLAGELPTIGRMAALLGNQMATLRIVGHGAKPEGDNTS